MGEGIGRAHVRLAGAGCSSNPCNIIRLTFYIQSNVDWLMLVCVTTQHQARQAYQTQGVVVMRILKHHEKRLLKKVNFIEGWKHERNVREIKVLRRYLIQDREDYVK